MQSVISALPFLSQIGQIPSHFSIQLSSILIWLTSLTIASLGLVVLLGNRSLASKTFAGLSFLVSLWLISHGFINSAADPQTASYFVKSTYFFGGVLAADFLYFALVFPEGTKPRKGIVPLLILSQLLLLLIYALTDSIVHGAVFVGGYERWGWQYGNLSFLFDIFFFGYWGGGMLVLFKKYLNEPASIIKTRLRYMLIAMIIAVSPPSLTNIFLPRIGYFSLSWFGAISVLGYIIIMSYSIVKYNQMEVKAVASEVLVIAMVVFLFVNIFLNGPVLGVAGRIGIFFAFAVLGSYLVRSILREVAQKEQLALLNDQLGENNLKLNDKTVELNQQLAEIERMNKYMVDRELKMVELKRRVEELESKQHDH